VMAKKGGFKAAGKSAFSHDEPSEEIQQDERQGDETPPRSRKHRRSLERLRRITRPTIQNIRNSRNLRGEKRNDE